MQNIKDLTYLLACALNGQDANSKICDKINFNEVYKISKKHNISPCVYIAIKNYKGINIEAFEKEYDANTRKNMLLDLERSVIFEYLDNNEVWHMPMKGIISQKMYPEYGMRQMADNDILFDPKFANQLDKFMLKRNYSSHKEELHNTYIKKPIYNFEMHKMLFSTTHPSTFHNYFNNIEPMIIKDNNLWRLTDNFFYIYQICHEYKHNTRVGTGLKQFIDIYISVKNLDLDYDFLKKEFYKLGITDYEEDNRKLALKLFENPDEFPVLSKKEEKNLRALFNSSTYGTEEEYFSKKLEGLKKDPKGYSKYLFPSLENMQKRGLTYAKHKAFVPFYWVRLYVSKLKEHKFKTVIKAIFKRH